MFNLIKNNIIINCFLNREIKKKYLGLIIFIYSVKAMIRIIMDAVANCVVSIIK